MSIDKGSFCPTHGTPGFTHWLTPSSFCLPIISNKKHNKNHGFNYSKTAGCLNSKINKTMHCSGIHNVQRHEGQGENGREISLSGFYYSKSWVFNNKQKQKIQLWFQKIISFCDSLHLLCVRANSSSCFFWEPFLRHNPALFIIFGFVLPKWVFPPQPSCQ